MKFTMIVAHANAEGEPLDRSTAWREPMNEPDIETEEAARAYAAEVVRNFNDTLRPQEKPRALIDVEFGDNNKAAKHDWEKTNLTTQEVRGRIFDSYRCNRCGITAKRFGVGGDFVRDPAFKAQAFASCDTAKARMDKRRRAQEDEQEAAE